MGTLRAFMRENVKVKDNEFHVISDRFVDENGEPIRFEFRRLKSKEVDAANDAAISKGKKRKDYDIDTRKLMHSLVISSLVYPDLEDVELQKSYGVMSADALIDEMFYADEYSKIVSIVGEMAGFDKDDMELIDEAKNS